MLKRMTRFFDLPARERRLLVRARVQLLCASWLLPIGGLARTSRFIERLNPPRSSAPSGDIPARVRRTVELLASASRVGPAGTCLTRSLVLRGLLRRQGIDATLRMGVRKDDSVEGHAWVEVDGQPVNDSADVGERYTPFTADLR